MGVGAKTWPGFVKLKLVHRQGATILLPVVILLGRRGEQWMQPHFVYAPMLNLTSNEATFWVSALDPDRGERNDLLCQVSFSLTGLRATLADRSHVYECEITTHFSPAELAVGRARVRADGGVDLRLHHHTTRDTLALIHRSGNLRGSAWNYQGTRELDNVRYVYFTTMARIREEQDLRRIAMASRGKLHFRLDTNHSASADLELTVYREATCNRKATLSLWVPAEAVSTPHIWKHTNMTVEYEVVHPWIYRVGLEPSAVLPFLGGEADFVEADAKRFPYAVVGDCLTLPGLAAPFDEENTNETFVIEDLSGTDVFAFWRANANASLFEPPTDVQTFAPKSVPP